MNIRSTITDFAQATATFRPSVKTHADQIETFLCIGAVPDPSEEEHGLSVNDFYIYRDVLNTLVSGWHVPSAGSFDKKVVNIDPNYGGLDFLKMPAASIDADVLILHNIPKDTEQVNSTITHGERDVAATSVLRQACSAFASSDRHHALEDWRRQIAASGAKIVFVYGADSFEADDLITDDYVAVPYNLQYNGLKQAILIDRYYLARIAYSPDMEPKLSDFADENGLYGSKPVRALTPA